MDLKTTRWESEDGVATLTLSRPPRHNAWTGRMHTELRHLLQRAESDLVAHETRPPAPALRQGTLKAQRHRLHGVERIRHVEPPLLLPLARRGVDVPLANVVVVGHQVGMGHMVGGE